MPRQRSIPTTLALASLTLLATACAEDPFPSDAELQQLLDATRLTSSAPLDATNAHQNDPLAIELGTKLFHDKGLSSCGTISCESCHGGMGLTVDTPLAKGCGGDTAHNPPSLWNVAWLDEFMWDGRADRLWNQAVLPMTNPVEMAATPATVRTLLTTSYAADYQKVFGEPVSATADERILANVSKAIAAYENTLRSPNPRFDEDVARFAAAVKAGTEPQDPSFLGFKVLVRRGACLTCHKGPRLSDSGFHNVGVSDLNAGAAGALLGIDATYDWPYSSRGPHSDDPEGAAANRLLTLRLEIQQRPANFLGARRTPSLRAIGLTAPYMHTGALAKLEDVVDFYSRGGDKEGTFLGAKSVTIVPLNLSNEEKAALLEVLKSM
ncbi:MAG: cytochrome-c peroxidase [Myxococcaceae bacterium]|nr:cytochrome-c peroxidase [Myxococcaceae bacterium]